MIATLEKLQTQVRRLDRVNLGVAGALKAMQRDGCALHCELGESGTYWWLSNGWRVRSNIARVVILNPSVVGVDTALFAGTPAQTYRFIGND
jgi:hypothetical protein